MKTIAKVSLIFLLAMAVMAGCSGSNGKNGANGTNGTTGPTGPQGPTDPTVSWVMPVQGATGVYTDSVIKVGFSKPISSSTINASTFSVSINGVPVPGTISYNSGSQTAFFDPTIPLSQFGFYTATLTTGIKDTSGNTIPASYTWTFMSGASATPSRLYVTDENISSSNIEVFNNAGMDDGNIVPDRTITGASTTLTGPEGMWLDKGSDRLYIPNWNGNNIIVFNNASTTNGNVAPYRTIVGAATSLNEPTGVWLDPASERLYVANYGGGSILVFNNASAINGNVAPSQTILGGSTGLSNPHGLWLNSASDTLYVADYSNNSIPVFANANTATGNIAPTRTISGANTTLNGPEGLWLDSTSDTLYVANTAASSILVFNSASTINGNIAPSRTISGASTTLNGPFSIWYDSSSDRLYVANTIGSSILVFNSASTINGNVAPSRTISGASTGLISSAKVWLDLNP